MNVRKNVVGDVWLDLQLVDCIIANAVLDEVSVVTIEERKLEVEFGVALCQKLL